MFFVIYLRRELRRQMRRQMRQAVFIAAAAPKLSATVGSWRIAGLRPAGALARVA